MDSQLRSHYLNALNVPEFLHAQIKPKMQTPHAIYTQCLVIETQRAHSFCQAGKSQDFLLKMLASIGLGQSDVACENINIDDLPATLSRYNAKTVLLMNADLTPVSKAHFFTHHPSAILKNKALKREAWEVLKTLKTSL